MKSKLVLFYRDFRSFTGGHLKVWHYFNHVRNAPGFEPAVFFSATSMWNTSNPWFAAKQSVERNWRPDLADVLFLGAMDWLQLERYGRPGPRKPIINFIQHVRHGNPADKRHRFLKNRAIRICVSEQVAEAVRNTGKANGPIYTVPNGIEFDELDPSPTGNRDIDLLIVGVKRPRLARLVHQGIKMSVWLRRARRWDRVKLLDDKIPRREFLDLLGRTKTTLFLPNPTEGFYLPALEGMALGTVVVCPDCVGNRSFCLPGYNCFRPEYSMKSILAELAATRLLTQDHCSEMIAAAKKTAGDYTIEAERLSFLEILVNLKQIW